MKSSSLLRRVVAAALIVAMAALFSGSAPNGDSSNSSGGAFGMVIIIIAVVVFLVVRRQKRRTAQEKAVAGKITAEADSYAAAKRAEADAYYEQQCSAAKEEVGKIEKEIADLQETLATLSNETMAEAIDVDAYSSLRSDEVKNELALLKVREDELVKSGKAYTADAAGRKMTEINTQAKQLLRCFNSESSSIIEGVTAKNADTVRGKLRRSYDALNNLFKKDGVAISEEYLSMKLEELSLVYAYMLKLEEEKEQRKAIREQMVEEEKVRREIEREKAKIEKEETQFSNEVKKLMGYMQKAKDDVEKQLYIDKIKELEDKLKALAADKENVLQREQNTRAGFVYIISNIGSFGEQVFKIGMTRRLEPMERIDELSSASVPFKFDVHALIFSDDAPALEAILHQTFRSNQVNKVNPRKEFYRVDLEEIKKVVKENHNATVQFIDVPDAEEYRETLRIERQDKAEEEK